MRAANRDYIPAFGKDFLLPFFDPLVRILGADRLRGRLLDDARLLAGQRVLDIGCGTGTLTIVIKRRCPGIEIVGLDPDPKALARARLKAKRARLSIQLDRGFAQELPYPDGSFDRAISTLTLHHLSTQAKKVALGEARRVLKPGGSLHVLDMAGDVPHGHGRLFQWLHSRFHPRDNSAYIILGLMRDAGFRDPQHYASDRLLAGLCVEFYRAAV